MPFRTNLVRARKKKGLTQAELAAELKISDKAVSQWERGETVPELEKIPRIAKALGTSAGWLLDDELRLGPTERAIVDMLEAAIPEDRAGALRLLKAYLSQT